VKGSAHFLVCLAWPKDSRTHFPMSDTNCVP